MLLDDVCALKCEATVRSRMEDFKKLALSVLVREAASRLGFMNVKPQQMETILAFCQGKDVFVSLPTGFGKTLIFAVLPSLFNTIRQSTTSIVVVESPSSSDGGTKEEVYPDGSECGIPGRIAVGPTSNQSRFAREP